MSLFSRLFKFDKAVYGWVFYDWANSAFATTVMAGFFPVFFKNYWSAGTDPNMSTAQLGFGNSLGGLMVALLAPVLGAIADRSSARKKFLIFFAYLGSLMTAALFLVQQGDWKTAILVYALGTVGFSGANIFYDSLLSDVSSEENADYISGLGYGFGYLGGGVLFALNVWMTLKPAFFGLPDAATAVRFSFLTVGLWWAGFTIFTLLWVKEKRYYTTADRLGATVREGFRHFIRTFRQIRHLKTLSTFLLAYWLYIDGVHTIIRMAVDYGMSIGFADTDLITALLIVQFVGFPAAIAYAKFGERWGVRRALFVGIFAYMFITLGGMMITKPIQFYFIAIAVGCFQGGLQALSRSYYNRMVPPGQAGEFFGFYNMIGKFAVIIGPMLVGLAGLLAKYLLVSEGLSPEELQHIGQTASRWSIGAVMLLFIAGAILLAFVNEASGKREMQEYRRRLQQSR